MFWLWQGAWPPPRQATRVRGDPTCQLALPAQSGAEAVVKDTFPDVEVQRQTVLTGGLLQKFPREKTEFVRLKKDEKWLIHAVCGPMSVGSLSLCRILPRSLRRQIARTVGV